MQARIKSALVLLLLPGFAAGCGNDYYAKQLVTPDAGFGRMHEMTFPLNAEMVRDGTISAFRDVDMSDGVKLDVWLVNPSGLQGATRPQTAPSGGSKGTVVVLHGWLDSKARYIPVARQLAGLGYQVVLIDLRAHGRSAGRYISWGAIERKDVKVVMDRLLAAVKLSKPLLLAHGTADSVVPIRHSREIFQAASGPRKIIEIPFADHMTTPWGREPWLAKQGDEMICNGLAKPQQ